MVASVERALGAALLVVASIAGCGLGSGPSDERLAGEGELPDPNAPPSTPSGPAPPTPTPSESAPPTPGPMPSHEPKLVFATQVAVTGRITLGDGGRGGRGDGDDGPTGREAADAICNDDAKRAGLAGMYVAWLSKEGEDAIARIPENANGWKLPSGPLVFPSRAHIAAGKGPLQPILRTASGAIITTDLGVWTATYENGQTQNPSCDGWRSTQGTGVGGALDSVGAKWTSDVVAYCTNQRRIVCFQR